MFRNCSMDTSVENSVEMSHRSEVNHSTNHILGYIPKQNVETRSSGIKGQAPPLFMSQSSKFEIKIFETTFNLVHVRVFSFKTLKF